MQETGLNIARTSGYSPINVGITQSFAGGAAGLHNFLLSMSVGGFPIANTQPSLKIFEVSSNTLLAEARFNYGDDISSAVPLFDFNFVSQFQAFMQAGSLFQDGATIAFAKKTWAESSSNSGRPYDTGAIELRFEVSLNIGGSADDIADIQQQYANHRQFNMAVIDNDYLIGVRYLFNDIRIIDRNTGDTRLTSIAGYNIASLSADYSRTINSKPVIMARVDEIATGNQYISEITFDGVNDWNLALVSAPLTLLDAVCIQVDTLASRKVNGRPVIFGTRTGQVICYAWDGVSQYIESSIAAQAGERGWSIQINESTGDLFVAMHYTPGTQGNRIRRYFWNGADVTLSTSWTTNNVIASDNINIFTCGKMFQDSTKMAREGKMRVVGYDGVIGLKGGSVPMFYIFGGNSGAAGNDLAKEIWNGVSGFTRTVLGAGWGNTNQVKSDGMCFDRINGKIYTSSTFSDDRLREIDIQTEVKRQVQVNQGSFAEYVTF